MEVGGLCLGMGEERRWMKWRRRRRDVWLPDRSRGKVAHSWGMYKCLFYTKRRDVLKKEEEARVFKNYGISVQSSQINIDHHIFPFSPTFFLGSGSRAVIRATLYARFVQSLLGSSHPPPTPHTTETNSMSNPVKLCDPEWTLWETS